MAVMFEGSTASGTEQAYRKAMDKLTELLIAEDAIHAGRHIFSLPSDVLTEHILLPP